MGAHPKRRISTGRAGRRQKNNKIEFKQPTQHAVPFHKRSIIEQIKKLFSSNE